MSIERHVWGKNLEQDYIWGLVCCYSPDERLKRRFLMLQTYIDDSGTNPREKYFVLAGFLADAETWAEFSKDWALALNEHPKINYFKNNHSLSCKGEFEKWKKEDIKKKTENLIQIILKHKLVRVSVSVSHEDFEIDFKQKFSGLKTASNPFCFLFFNMIVFLTNYAKENLQNTKINFIFDNQGKIGYHAVTIFNQVRNILTPELRDFYAGIPTFQDDKEIVPLQAADLLAGSVRRFLYENHSVKTPAGYQIESLNSLPGFHKILHPKEFADSFPKYYDEYVSALNKH